MERRAGSLGARGRARKAAPAGPAGLGPATVVALLLAGLQIGVFLAVAGARLGYPYELEWLEGAVLDQVKRLLDGQPLYVAPAVDYVPLNYPPGYFHAAAWVARLAGAEFAALRLVSLAAALALFALIGVHVARETGRRSAGLIAAGVFAASYGRGGFWLDIARADTLHLALAFAGVVAIRHGGRSWAPGAAGVLWTLSFLCKQSAPAMLLPLIAWLLWRDRRRGAIAALTFAATSAAAVLALDAAHQGWLRFYVFDLPRRFTIDPALGGNFLIELLPFAPALALVAIAATRRGDSRGGALGFNTAFALGAVGVSVYLSLYRGAYLNVYLPAHLAFAVLAGWAWGALAASPGGRRAAIGTALVCLQLLLPFRDPRSQIPGARDVAAGDQAVALLRALRGPVWVSSHPYLLARAGKPGHAHVAPFFDLVKGVDTPAVQSMWRAFQDSLAAHAWPVLVLDRYDWLGSGALAAGYVGYQAVHADSQAFWPPTGMRTRPEYVLVPAAMLDATPAAP